MVGVNNASPLSGTYQRIDFGVRPDRVSIDVNEEALLVTGEGSLHEIESAARVACFFGISSRILNGAELMVCIGSHPEGSARYRLICSSDTFLQVMALLGKDSNKLERLPSCVHSAFVFAGHEPESLARVTKALIKSEKAELVQNAQCPGDYVLSDKLGDFCGVMAGVRIAASKAAVDDSLIIRTPQENSVNIISVEGGAAFLRLEFCGVPVFLSTCRRIVDLNTELPTGIFDIRDYVLPAMPIVLYVKWAFAGTCWNAAENNACLVIDDPLLKPAYGFVNFHELLSLMERLTFSTNIAFIPWNWRRSAPNVAQLFRDNPERYSLSVHGCDHTRAEFGSSDRQRLYWKARQALERMGRHEGQTGIHHNAVMVFPQGVFSEAAMSVLKCTGFIAAVNNDTISADPHPRAIRIADVWDVAVMSYSDFPLFTRRYPWEGVENFAFEVLLGKPSIIVIHHDFCLDSYARLTEFIAHVNALKCPLSWRSLGEVVRRSCRWREISQDTLEVEMYGTELRVGNRSAQPKRLLIGRRESDPSSIKVVSVGVRPVEWKFSNGRITFEVELSAGQSEMVALKFHDLGDSGRVHEHLVYKLNTMLRRYLCEVRDNYVVKLQKRTED